MRHREAYTLCKVTLWLGEEDWAWLLARHRYGASKIIRDLIHQHRVKMEAPRGIEKISFDLDLEGL
jgi:hypothetical protein